MRFSTKTYIKLGIGLSLILGMGATSFAGNTIGDVPASVNELRPITRVTTPYTDSCDIEQNLAFYDKSPVYLRVGQPKSTINYVFDKTVTYVIVYNQPLFAGNLKFPYVANFVPSTSFETDTSNILTVEATGSTFSGGSMTMNRNQVAGQIITKNNERAALQNNAGATLSYYYRLANTNFTLKQGTVKINIHPNITPKTSCTNYYIARCGDGILDKPTGSTDGNGGIVTQGGTFVPRHARSTGQNEFCDDGGVPGGCKDDCTAMEGPATGAAGCDITASVSTIEAGQSVIINASYTSGASATITPTLSRTPAFSTPSRNGSVTDTPTQTTTYTMTVQGIPGVDDSTCSTTVTVNPPQQHLQCSFLFNPNPVVVNQWAAVGRNVTGGNNFQGTNIYVNPYANGRPKRVDADEFNGVEMIQPTQTGDYIFSMLVNNLGEQYTCTGALHVIDPVVTPTNPTCELTATTPTITAGQTTTLSGRYANGTLATITPNVIGTNFVYPSRSNSNMTVAPTITTTYTMMVLGQTGTTPAICSTTVYVAHPQINFNKELVTNIPYHSGDIMTFKVNFSNVGTSTVNNVVISDFLPLSLEYVDSQMFGISPYTVTTGTVVGGEHYVIYSGFSLTPGQAGYILIQARYKGIYGDRTINNAYFQSPDLPDDLYAPASFIVYAPSGHATVTKTASKPAYYLGEDALFTIAVTNNGPDAISNITITDDRPNTTCIVPDNQRTSNTSNITMTSPTDPYAWFYNGSLAAGQTIYIYITGHVSTSPTCAGTYANNANASYVSNGQIQTGIAPQVVFTITTTPTSTMGFEKKLVQYGNNPGDPVIFELLYQNNGNATITSFDITDYRPGTLNFLSATPMPNLQTPTPGGMNLVRTFTTPLPPNGTGKITINGSIK